ncbi:MAG: aquaporin [Acidimicrobiales bacterium]|nr:aquaporin [Acidimicrobiales bacterium]HLV90273.1 aquaporin [Acidimicrobiia bacterium]
MVINKYLAELLGTMILVAVGSLGILAVGGAGGPAEIVAIALAFGLALFAGISALGHVSGGHFNPAVTLAMLVDKRISLSDAIGYWVGQIAGGVVGSAVILAAAGQDGVAMTNTGYDELSRAITVEVLLTAVFVWVIMAVTRKAGSHVPLTIGLTLVMVHLAGIPFSGASVNPARSFGPAVISGEFTNIGVYLYAPLIGGLIAAVLYRLFPVKDD